MLGWGKEKESKVMAQGARRIGAGTHVPRQPAHAEVVESAHSEHLDSEVRQQDTDAVDVSIDAANNPTIREFGLSAAEQQFIDELQRDEWKGVITTYINDIHRAHCVVADLGILNVRIMATQAHSVTGAYLSMVAAMKKQHFKVETEVHGTPEAIARIYELSSQKARSLGTNGVSAEDARFSHFYDDLIAKAYRLKASDAHFEIDNGVVGNVRLRIFGRMRPWLSYPAEVIERAVSAGFSSRTKIGTNSSGTFSIERGMNTMTTHKVDGVNIEGRFTSLPTYSGCDIVVRLLVSDPRKVSIPSLKELGYENSQTTQIISALKKNSGLLSIAGSTGSGKSTSLRTFMHIIPRKEELKMASIEDPVEYAQPGVRQFSVQRGPDDPEDVVKTKFLGMLRSQMRMDPDVLMIGEIRDAESGAIASEFVQTGHRVLTSIHGDGAVDVLSRAAGDLIQIPNEILSMRKFISASIYQKLLPVLCSCKRPAHDVLHAETLKLLREKFKLDPKTMYCANEDGCELCRVQGIEGSGGTIGQTVCAEILIPTQEMRECILNRDWNGVERLWRFQRRTSFGDPDMTGKTAFEHALYKASIGIADIRDIEADFESLDTYEIFESGIGGASQ